MAATAECIYAEDRDAWTAQDSGATCCSATCLTIVILGATGDLAKKKTFPSIARLFIRGFLPEQFAIIGFGRSDYTDDKLRERIKPGLPHGEDDKVDAFLKRISYVRGSGYDAPDGYKALQDLLCERETNSKCTTLGRLFYLAVPPSVYVGVMTQIKNECSALPGSGGNSNGNGNGAPSLPSEGWVRVIVEKPFGRDLESAEDLSREVAQRFSEDQVYRIDHFLGKEVAQNLLVMRFTNPFLSAVWSNVYIDNIQIIMKESFGTEGRGGYFDAYGIIRDVIQNHLLQILALLTMERPVNLHPDDIRDEKTKVIRSMRIHGAQDVVIGQYTAGSGHPGYTDLNDVPNDSTTATYAVCRIAVENERWEGVPMIIKAGKALNEDKMEVRVQFKTQPGFFGEDASGMRNEFVMQLKPKDAMYMKIVMKKPGLELAPSMSELNLTYAERFDDYIPEAYERLILDAINGNQQHFVRRDELRASWTLFDPVLKQIDEGTGPALEKYAFGSRGVDAGDQLIAESGYVRSRKYAWSSEGKTKAL